MANISKVQIGPVTVVYGGVNLGHTHGGAKLKFDRKFTELEVDQYGKTPVDLALNGNDLTVEVELAEPIVDYLYAAIPEGGDAIGGLGEKLGLGADAGAKLSAFAKLLTLHPVALPASNLSQDITIFKAVNWHPLEMDYKVDGQRVFKVIFRALVDETRGNGYRLGQIGPSTIS